MAASGKVAVGKALRQGSPGQSLKRDTQGGASAYADKSARYSHRELSRRREESAVLHCLTANQDCTTPKCPIYSKGRRSIESKPTHTSQPAFSQRWSRSDIQRLPNRLDDVGSGDSSSRCHLHLSIARAPNRFFPALDIVCSDCNRRSDVACRLGSIRRSWRTASHRRPRISLCSTRLCRCRIQSAPDVADRLA